MLFLQVELTANAPTYQTKRNMSKLMRIEALETIED